MLEPSRPGFKKCFECGKIMRRENTPDPGVVYRYRCDCGYMEWLTVKETFEMDDIEFATCLFTMARPKQRVLQEKV